MSEITVEPAPYPFKSPYTSNFVRKGTQGVLWKEWLEYYTRGSTRILFFDSLQPEQVLALQEYAPELDVETIMSVPSLHLQLLYGDIIKYGPKADEYIEFCRLAVAFVNADPESEQAELIREFIHDEAFSNRSPTIPALKGTTERDENRRMPEDIIRLGMSLFTDEHSRKLSKAVYQNWGVGTLSGDGDVFIANRSLKTASVSIVHQDRLQPGSEDERKQQESYKVTARFMEAAKRLTESNQS